MARVLQIRRGTTAQNNNFTGMPGEISYDTDAKTLRVHDGQTLGGFALARADQSGNTGGGNTGGAGFDITTVPDTFWAEKVAQFAPAPFTLHESRPTPINTTGYLDCVFADAGIPKIIKVTLICQTPEAGYAIGDEVSSFGMGSTVCPAPNTFTDDEGLHVCLMMGSQTFWVSHRNTGAATNITNTKWRIKFRVYC